MSVNTMMIPEWKDIMNDDMTESQVYRHFMFLGETGSGKTVSAVLPICRLAFSRDSKLNASQPAAGLAIDPKSELWETISGMDGMDAEKRLIRLQSNCKGPVLWLFENIDIHNLDAGAIADEILLLSESYQSQIKNDGGDKFWIQGSRQWLNAIIDIDLTLYRKCGIHGLQTFWRQFHGLLNSSIETERKSRNYYYQSNEAEPMNGDTPEASHESESVCGDTPEASQEADPLSMFLNEFRTRKLNAETIDNLLALDTETVNHDHGYQRENYIHHILRLVSDSTYFGAKFIGSHHLNIDSNSEAFNDFWGFFVAFVEGYHVGGMKVFNRQESYFRQWAVMCDKTYTSFIAVFNSMIVDFKDSEFCSRISVNPFEPPEQLLSVQNVIESGQIVVYEPGIESRITSCVGKTLKSGFFRRLLNSKRLNNPASRPFFYICDEFQRFITHDEQSGEQSFLDRCRAYKVCCALATQSLASLRYAFPDQKGLHSINILITNTGTKLFFRSTDTGISKTLMDLIPAPERQGRPHVVSVRPPSSLQPGECYYVLVNGEAGRGQIIM